MQSIEFRRIEGFGNKYFISNSGIIISTCAQYGLKRLKIMKKRHDRDGYLRACLTIKPGIEKTCLVHRLVAGAFIKNTNSYPLINHINGVRDDNRIENLEWCTHSMNQLHSFRVLKTRPGKIGEQNPQAKLTEETVKIIRSLKNSGISHSKIAKAYGISQTVASAIISRRSWKHVK